MNPKNPNTKNHLRRANALLVLILAMGAVGCEGARTSASPTPTTVSATATMRPVRATVTPEATASQTKEFILTFYGAVDNDPPGSTDVAYPDVQPHAGGTGTYNDPLTFAVAEGLEGFTKGEIIYVPGLGKYFRFADTCGASPSAPDGCGTQLDLYIGNPSKDERALACENALTPDGPAKVILNPDANWPVNETPLWSDATQQCGTASW